ncbi:hypothetical protein D3C78_1791600 [compost metagenome]
MIQQLGDVIWGNKVIYAGHPAFRVDRQDPLCHHFGFRLANMLAQSMDLPIGVGDADVIHVDQGDRTNAGACQRFSRP